MIDSIVLRQATTDDVPAIMEIETPVFAGEDCWLPEAQVMAIFKPLPCYPSFAAQVSDAVS